MMTSQVKKKQIGYIKDISLGFNVINTVFLITAGLVVLLPLLYVVACSFSNPSAVIKGEVTLFPVGFNVDAYAQIFQSKMLLTGYKNSILYTVVGTSINIIMTILAAYPLSVKDFVGRKIFTALFVFVMIFEAPLIPSFLVVKQLGLYDSMWALILPGAIGVYNMIIARTYFASIPNEIQEAARIDGASDLKILLKIILPLSKPIIAVLVLYYAVAHWNSYFAAYIYLTSESKLTLQVVLRNIMSSAAQLQEMTGISAADAARASNIEVLRYSVIVFGSLPVIALYPFVQKYFVKGVMIGSVKG